MHSMLMSNLAHEIVADRLRDAERARIAKTARIRNPPTSRRGRRVAASLWGRRRARGAAVV